MLYSYVHLSLDFIVDVIFLELLKLFRNIRQKNHSFLLDHQIFMTKSCLHTTFLSSVASSLWWIFQVYSKLLVKVLTLSKFWTCLHMAMKFLSCCEFQCSCQFCYLFLGLQCPYSHLIFCCYKSSSNFSIIFELENTGCKFF